MITPSSPVNKTDLERGIKTLISLGFRVKKAGHLLDKNSYLAGTDKIRAGQIDSMFRDSSVDGIICARGGYGSLRILEQLDYNSIRKNPKVLVGFSDITPLHLAIQKFCKFITFHGPMLAIDFPRLSDYNRKYFIRAVAVSKPVGPVKNSPKLGRWKVISKGHASGAITGGNLTLITRLLGTRFEPDFKDKILFLEDLDEEPYKIDGLLAQLKLAGILKKVRGVILAEFIRCRPKKKPSFTTEEVFRQYFSSARYPVIYPVSCGHGPDKITIPLGVKVTLDTGQGIFSIDESGVR